MVLGLLRELVLVLLNGEHRPALPVFGFLELLTGLILKPLLVGDRGSDLLLCLYQLRSHVENDLVEHLLGLLELGDHRVDVGAEEHRDSIEDIHIVSGLILSTATSVVRALRSSDASFQ